KQAVGHRRDAPLGADAVAGIVGEGHAVDADVAGPVAEEHAGAAIAFDGAAKPAQRAHLAAAVEVSEIGAAQTIADHGRVRHHAFEDAAADVQAVTADAADGDVLEIEVVDPAVVAVGDDLDAGALAAVTLDGEIGQCQIAEIDART